MDTDKMEMRFIIDADFKVGSKVTAIPIVKRGNSIINVGKALKIGVTDRETDIIKMEAGLLGKSWVEVTSLNDIKHSVVKSKDCINESILAEAIEKRFSKAGV